MGRYSVCDWLPWHTCICIQQIQTLDGIKNKCITTTRTEGSLATVRSDSVCEWSNNPEKSDSATYNLAVSLSIWFKVGEWFGVVINDFICWFWRENFCETRTESQRIQHKIKQKSESGNKETKGKSMKEEEGNNGKKIGLLVFQFFLLNLL